MEIEEEPIILAASTRPVEQLSAEKLEALRQAALARLNQLRQKEEQEEQLSKQLK